MHHGKLKRRHNIYFRSVIRSSVLTISGVVSGGSEYVASLSLCIFDDYSSVVMGLLVSGEAFLTDLRHLRYLSACRSMVSRSGDV